MRGGQVRQERSELRRPESRVRSHIWVEVVDEQIRVIAQYSITTDTEERRAADSDACHCEASTR
jgi:hypothetical protein